MKKAEKVQQIMDILERLYPKTPVPLNHDDPYTLLIAVLLSAQTTDKKVNQVTPGLFALADNPADMAKKKEADILKRIRQLGLAKTKAKNIKRLSALLMERHDGRVPVDMAALEDLPGVGHKTASVVMAQAFGVPTFPVDTHIHRLAWRWGLSKSTNVKQTEKDCKRLFPRDRWNKLHLQIIFFGREHCPARGHDPDACPICRWGGVKRRLALEAKLGRGGPHRY
ncbi:MAG: endonuclease III [Myxococcota bacterium]